MALTSSFLVKSKSAGDFKNIFNVFAKETGRRWSSKYFITTPIFYVNAEPHIGHLYTAVIADAACRFQKLKNPEIQTKFMVGTDEHGLKVSQSAENCNMDVKTYCDKISNRYRNLFDLFSIEADDFVRTTYERHGKAAVALWNKISSKGYIYKDKYSGWYCVSDEMFVAEHLLGQSVDSKGLRYTLEDNKPVHFVEEINYKFKLKNFRDDLLYWLKGDVVKPKIFQEKLYKSIDEGRVLYDISVSRPTNRVPWGIQIPGDDSQTMYVWMDALASYLCTNGYPEESFSWPPDVQVIGKDILKFHGVFWPAFLIAADLEPPKRLLCHCHWLKDDTKMSKSKGNVVDPFQQEKKYTSDGFRYFLLKDGVPHNDGNFSADKIMKYLNADLANSLGNLLNRCTSSTLNPNQVFTSSPEHYDLDDPNSRELKEALKSLPELVETHFEEFHFYKGLDEIMRVLALTNKFFQDLEPWNLKKDPRKENKLQGILGLCLESLRVCGILLQPVIPKISNSLLNKLSIPTDKRNLRNIQPFSWELSDTPEPLQLSSEKVIIFAKIQQ